MYGCKTKILHMIWATGFIKQNTPVEFLLVAGGWRVELASTGALLTRGYFGDGARRATLTPAPLGTGTVTFNALGGTETTNADATLRMNAVTVQAPDAVRTLRVVVGVSMNGIRVCDPKFVYPADPKGC